MSGELLRAKKFRKAITKKNKKQFFGPVVFNLSGFHLCEIYNKKSESKLAEIKK